MTADLKIFVSYARNDDQQEIPGKGKGFITALLEHVRSRFVLFGPPTPDLFRDTSEIWESDQFDPILQQSIAESQLFLVVLSNNWIHREWCVKELSLFEQRWGNTGFDEVRKRVIVISKSHVPLPDRPAALQGQDGYRFYRLENELGKPSGEYPFFFRGEPRDEFHDVIDRLAQDLRRRAVAAEPFHQAAAPAAVEPAPEGTRTFFLAKPAGDMELSYRRLVDELRGQGYAVVPDPDVDIPASTAATQFIEEALAKSEASIHLLGEKKGGTPFEDALPIVQMQLALAGEECNKPGRECGGGTQKFRRILWAPKMLVDPAGGALIAERDPLEVLGRFDRYHDTDKVDGSEIGKFVEFVLQNLKPVRNEEADTAIPENARVYVYHRPDDLEYGRRLARTLRGVNLKPILPTFEGDMVRKVHEVNLRECDAVVLGWVNADDSWIRATAREWHDWRVLGRTTSFACRALVAGPPQREAKETLLEFPPDEVDVVVDLTKPDTDLSPEALEPLIKRTRNGASASDLG